MHDLQTRFSAITSLFMTVVFLQLGLAGLSNYFLIETVGTSDLSIHKLVASSVTLREGRIGGYDWYDYKLKMYQLGQVRFDLDADLSPLFNWNTKLLFVSVLVEFSNKDYPLNQAVIWDDIIMNKEDAVISLKGKKHEYPVHDLADILPGTTANMTLQYQVVPWVGSMVTYRKVFPNAVTFPDAKSS